MFLSADTATTTQVSPQRQLADYLQEINSPEFRSDEWSLKAVYETPKYNHLRPLFHRLFCTPATSAPVERVFSQSGLIIRPHRARMTDSLLETLVFLKCNSGK